jgi:predicted phosphodiesterase
MNEKAEARYAYADKIILGHSHKPGISGKIINGGDMIEHSTYIEIDGSSIAIKEL